MVKKLASGELAWLVIVNICRFGEFLNIPPKLAPVSLAGDLGSPTVMLLGYKIRKCEPTTLRCSGLGLGRTHNTILLQSQLHNQFSFYSSHLLISRVWRVIGNEGVRQSNFILSKNKKNRAKIAYLLFLFLLYTIMNCKPFQFF